MISEERLQQALTYLAETDDETAQFQTSMERAKWKANQILKASIASSDLKTVAEKEAEAHAQPEYIESMDAYFDFMLAHLQRKNKRITETIVVDVWRSENASRRAGNV